ncbi:Gfo/Idh/MocA family protein [Gayadomonas joobiniege]|uniref:Gfo/Idh/MocA family protein n=1 Tax=Gayadomonas joobiniege TaxID=1234606 RepID=UPI000361B87E|nr:Gfo/Idh/MocA family oxidoreductase [Gayadomonas joobiniege]
MSDIRWAVIGPGVIAHRFAQALQGQELGRIVAVASRSMVKAENFARLYGAEDFYDDYQQVYQHPDVDAIYIATTHNFHVHQVLASLNAGKHVLCEKPLGVNLAEVEQMQQLATEKGLFLMEALWSVFLPAYQQVKLWLDEGIIGEIKLIRSTFGFTAPNKPEHRLYRPELAGGTQLDMGVYNVATAHWFMGEAPHSIQAMGHIGETGVEEMVCANLGFSGGRIAQYTCTIQLSTDNVLYLFGENGHIEIQGGFWESQQVRLVTPNHSLEVQCPFAINGFEYEIEEAERCIREGKIQSSLVTHAFTREVMQTMQTVLEQIK